MDSRQQGAVSLFAVIFATLLLTILSIGFVKLMMAEQQQATDNDLSQSAYDSALAGVEDAKRAIRKCQMGDVVACSEINDASKVDDCQVIARANGLASQPEVVVRSDSSNGEAFDQAYTCVNITMDTDDYVYVSRTGTAEVIPLKSVADFEVIEVSWYTQNDAGEGNPATAPTKADGSPLASDDLPANASWGSTTPPILRLQLITPGSSFDITSLNSREASQTAFIKPNGIVSTVSDPPEINISPDTRPRPQTDELLDNSVDAILCSQIFGYQGYACSARLNLNRVINQTDSANTFLRINTIYNTGAEVKVRLLSGAGSTVKLNGIQPAIDSTGRASNLFRRIEARLRVGEDFPYPSYAVDTQNNLCKDFTLDGNVATPGSCVP